MLSKMTFLANIFGETEKKAQICTAFQLKAGRQRLYGITSWRDGRVIDCTGLENRRTERYRGFESLSLRKTDVKTDNQYLRRFSFSP